MTDVSATHKQRQEMILRKLLFLTTLLALCIGSSAQTLIRGPQKSLLGIEVHFRFDKHNLDKEYMGNAETLRRFAFIVDSIGLSRIDSVVIVSQSSPEGVYEHNMRLSRNRANTMRSYLEQAHPELNGKLHVYPDGESWQQLRNYVVHDTKLKDTTKEKILAIIDADINIGTKKWRMQQLPVYRYLITTYYPRIRNSMFCILYFNEIPINAAPAPELEPLPDSIARIPVYIEECDTLTPIAVKSNLLYDAVTALNVELEIPIGRRWSIAIEDVFPWWHKGNKYAFQMWEMGIEGRYWFHRTPERNVLTGHFIGLYGMSAKYDFQWRRDVNYQGEYWSAGLTYGYAMPIGKRFNIEFSVSMGYLSTAYRHYMPTPEWDNLVRDPYEWGRKGYIGPTKAKVSLVFPVNLFTKTRKEVCYE